MLTRPKHTVLGAGIEPKDALKNSFFPLEYDPEENPLYPPARISDNEETA